MKTIQETDSYKGGVVNEPGYVKYCLSSGINLFKSRLSSKETISEAFCMSLNLLQIFSNSGCSSSPYDRVGNGFFREFRNNLRTYFGGGDGFKVATFMGNKTPALITGHNI